MIRTPIKLYFPRTGATVIALANDGTMWVAKTNIDIYETPATWEEITPLPQSKPAAPMPTLSIELANKEVELGARICPECNKVWDSLHDMGMCPGHAL